MSTDCQIEFNTERGASRRAVSVDNRSASCYDGHTAKEGWGMTETGNAVLSSSGEYTTFSYAGKTLTFLTGRDLDRYLSVKEWDHGYLVVTAKYKSRPEEEEYIDLLPILQNLYMDPESFLSPIKGVSIQYV